MLQVIAFYLLASTAVIAAFLVVSVRNPVHSVMFLITVFFAAAGLFVLMGAEFLALLLVMVYVGAVAVLFLFVVMMLDVDFVEMKQGFLQYLPAGLIFAVIFLIELIFVGAAWFTNDARRVQPNSDGVSNLEAFGNVLYTDYAFFFEAAGLVLLVALIGAVVLTHRKRDDVRRQDVNKQNNRTRDEAVELVDVKSGEGLGS